MYTAWFVIAGGIVLFLVGGRLRPRTMRIGFRARSKGETAANLSGLIVACSGLVVAALGVYAGLRGPVVLGPFEVPPLPYSWVQALKPVDALPYAQTSIKFTARPAIGWRGASDKIMEYQVTNAGKRRLNYFVVQYLTSQQYQTSRGNNSSTVDIKITGPFKPGQTSVAYPRIPSTVDRKYFKRMYTQVELPIVGAR